MAELRLKTGGIEIVRNIAGRNLLQVLKELIPDGFNPNDAVCYIGSRKVDLSKECINREVINDVRLLIAPKGFLSVASNTVIGLVASNLLIPEIPTASTSGGIKESPNNSFFGQKNEIRLDDQEPNIYGNVISYPDSVVRDGGAWSYVDDQKIIKQVFLIGNGSYEINSSAKFELTPLDEIDGSSSVVYQPGQTVPVVQGQFNSEFIDGQTLPGPNSDDVTDGVNATTNNGGNALTEISETLVALSVAPDSNWDSLFSSIGTKSNIPVQFEYDVYQEVATVCSPIRIVVVGLLSMFQPGGIGTDYIVNLDSVDPSLPNCQGVGDPVYGSYLEVTELLGSQLTVTVPIVTSELQISFDFRAGLRGTAVIRVDVSGDGASNIENEYEFTANTSKQKFFTKIVPMTFTGNIVVTMTRTNNEKDDGSDRVQVSQVATNEYRTNVDYGDRTMLYTERKATQQAVKTAQSKINIDVTRKTITYDINAGTVDLTLTASRSFADAILHEYVIINGQSDDDLPLDVLYEISDRIGALGNFDHTFDNKEQSLKEKLSIIANVARCNITYTGQGYEVYRDEVTLPAGQFDSRNITSESQEEVSFSSATVGSNDGVKLKWKNPDGNKFDYIYYVISGANVVKCIPQGGGVFIPSLPSIPYELDLTGCFTEDQADNRANMECLRFLHTQEALRITSLVDGENFNRGQVVKYADFYDEDVDSGEIKSINGNLYESFSEFKIAPGFYKISYTNQFGETLGPGDVEILDETFFTATLPDSYIADGFNQQCGSRFFISTQEEQDANLYQIIDKNPNSDGSVEFDLIQYSESIYPEA